MIYKLTLLLGLKNLDERTAVVLEMHEGFWASFKVIYELLIKVADLKRKERII